MEKFPRRKSIRLPDFDYSQSNYSFITLCSYRSRKIFSRIYEGKVYLNVFGRIVEDNLNNLHQRFNNVEIEKYVIMSDHVHFILIIKDSMEHNCRGAVSAPVHETPAFKNSNPLDAQTGGETQPPRSVKLGNVIAYLKYQAAKKINLIRNTPGQDVWQRNYYEHIIRDDCNYDNVWNYIDANPGKWESDHSHK